MLMQWDQFRTTEFARIVGFLQKWAKMCLATTFYDRQNSFSSLEIFRHLCPKIWYPGQRPMLMQWDYGTNFALQILTGLSNLEKNRSKCVLQLLFTSGKTVFLRFKTLKTFKILPNISSILRNIFVLPGLSIESDFAKGVDFDEVINKFAALKARKGKL
jgi:hypothetical protein